MSMLPGFLNSIEEMFEKDFSPEGRRTLEARLDKFQDDVFQMAIKNIESANLNWRPKWPEILSYCEKAEYKLRPPQEETMNVGGDTSDLQFRMFKKLREIMFNGSTTRQQIYDMIRKADKAQPGTGWDKCGWTLETDAKKHGYDLSKPPSNECGIN